jgi:uncharacterized protein YukE
MAKIRVSPSLLRESAKELEQTSAAIADALSHVQQAVNRAPSYNGQFAHQLNTFGTEATSRAHKHTGALSDLSDGLRVKADAFENADRVGADGISGIGQHHFTIKRGGPWFEIPDWIKEFIIGFLPLGDLLDIFKELKRLILEGETDDLVLALAVLGLIADLGWLDGFIPDGLDAANAALSALKTLVKGVPPGPAREAIRVVVQRLMRNTDEVPLFFGSLFEVLKHEEILIALGDNHKALAAVLDAGPEVMEHLGKNKEITLELLSYGDDALVILKNTEALDVLSRHGPEAIDAIRKAASSDLPEQALEAVEAALDLHRFGSEADEAASLIEKIATFSSHGSGDRVVIGKWVEGGGYVQEAVENGGVYYMTMDGVYDALGRSNDLAWLTNERFLKDQLERGINRIDIFGETIEHIERHAIGTTRWKEINFLKKHAAEYGYELVGNSWIKLP